MDTQTIELVGTHRLASELIEAGLEVAFPARDRGVDLIAYAEIDQQSGRFVARPIQLKVASARSFGAWQKYERIHDLILAFVWHVGGASKSETFALTFSESLVVADALGWTKTDSWLKAGGYGTTRPSPKLLRLLEPHRMDPDKWWLKVTGMARGQL
ncbi:MAG: hypothetical protein ABI565_14235 [Vicinamibacteria bacterium]